MKIEEYFQQTYNEDGIDRTLTMKALVIGATGIIGNHVVRTLLEKGIEVRALSRGITPSLNLEGLDIERIQGDLNDRQSLLKAMKGCGFVFHTAAYYPTHLFDLKGHTNHARLGLETVLNAAMDSQVEKFVFTSSLTTVGSQKKSGILADETCPVSYSSPPHPYFAVKTLMEDLVIQKAKMKELDAVVVNPTGCFGPYEMKPMHLCLIPQIAKKMLPAYVDHPINIVDVADVGRGHVQAALKGKNGERYLLGGHNTSIGETIRQIAAVAKVSPPKMKVPLSLALVPAICSEYLAYYMTHKLPRYPVLGLRFLQYGQHFNLQKAQNDLGYQISSMKPCYERALKWYQKIGYC